MVPVDLLNRVKQEYEQNGYAKIEGVFNRQEVDAIRSEAYRVIRSGHPELKSYLQKTPHGKPALLFGPSHFSEYMKRVADDPRMKGIVSHFLGPNVRQLNNQVYFRESGDGDEFAWHQDICFRTPPEDFSNIESCYLQTIVVVDEIYENAAIEFIPGSHKWGVVDGLVPRDNTERGLRKFVRGTYKGLKVAASPGDVLLWSVMIVHGSEKNESKRHRMTYMNGFASDSAILNKERFPMYMGESK